MEKQKLTTLTLLVNHSWNISEATGTTGILAGKPTTHTEEAQYATLLSLSRLILSSCQEDSYRPSYYGHRV